MSHIFISYSHKDKDYAFSLHQQLSEQGFDAWIDHRLDYGSQWPHEIQKQLDGCDAFIIILSHNAYQSEWVQSELQRAKRKQKPIFPLLLNGDEPWLSLETTQFYDVRNGGLPDLKFFKDLRKTIADAQSARTLKSTPTKPVVQKSSNLKWMLAGISLAVFLFFACGVALWGILKQFDWFYPPVETETATLEASSEGSLNSSEASQPPSLLGEMIFIPAGEFSMGRDDIPAQSPVHTVYLNSYYIDLYEVTQQQYKECYDDGACDPPQDENGVISYDPDYAYYPMVYATWDMANNFCAWRDLRLPTEAEWEKAARGDDQRLYPWGGDLSCDFANYNECKFENHYTPVGNFPQGVSPYGIFDMAGNVYEWVADYYAEDYYSQSPSESPTGPDYSDERVVRGGSWYTGPERLTTTFRIGFEPDKRFGDLGFRCAQDANE